MRLNLTLYDLKDKYNEKDDKTSFFIAFSNNSKEHQIGRNILNMHYLVLDMDRKSLLISPVNHYPDSWFSSVYFVRFFVISIIFCIAAMIAVGVWANFNKIDYYGIRKNKGK